MNYTSIGISLTTEQVEDVGVDFLLYYRAALARDNEPGDAPLIDAINVVLDSLLEEYEPLQTTDS